MDEKSGKQAYSTLISDNVRESVQEYQRENLRIRRTMEEGFFQKSLDYRDYVFAPEGYEGIV